MMDTATEVKAAIERALPGAVALVRGAGGHFEIVVTSADFAGKGTVEKQRLVYRAIKHLMAGDDAPVHAVDRLDCRTP